MSVTSNDKGGNEQRVNLIKRGPGKIQHVMLNSTLIKKAENYTLLTDRFLTNNVPGIMQYTRQLIEIRPRGGIGAGNVGFGAGAFLANRNTYTPPKIFSIGRLCESLAEFFRHFNFGLYIYGANYSNVTEQGNQGFVPVNLRHYIPRHALYIAGGSYGLRNEVPEDNVVQHVTLGFEADGSLQLTMSSQFLSNFFIILDPVFAKLVGFPEQIYSGLDAVPNGNVVFSNQPGVLPLIDGANNFALPSAVADLYSFTSNDSIFRVDDRLSIDVEITLPLARTIDVHKKQEKQTYLLSRFIVKDFVNVATVAQQRGGFLLTKSIMQDKLSTGFTDLVANQPGTHASQLKNGKIRELDVRLALRFKEWEVINGILTYSIKHKTIEMEEDGCYDLLLAFNKRV